MLLESKANPNSATDKGWTPLHYAAKFGHARIVDLLLEHGDDAKLKLPNGTTALILAAFGGYTETVRLLVNAGSDVNAVDKSGKTAISRAAEWGHTEVVRLLLGAGSDINAASSEGETALSRAVEWGNEAVVQLLLEKRDDIERGVTLDLEKLVRNAVQAHSGRTFQVLLKHGATLKDPDLLIRALKQRDRRMVSLLVENRADVNAANDGQTPPNYRD